MTTTSRRRLLAGLALWFGAPRVKQDPSKKSYEEQDKT